MVFYDAKTGVGLGKEEKRDFARQLAQRGFVALSLGGDPNSYFPDKEKAQLQPLSFHAYQAANCHNALANLPQVDPKRIGVVGHSYGGKWAMFASCLYDKFACAAWSDPGIVFDEKRANVNYWEPWYLGYEPGRERKPGIPDDKNPRTGPYKKLIEEGHDLHRTARPDGATAVPGFRRLGGRAGAVEGAQPRHRGEQVPRLRRPRRHDQPRRACADRRIE